MKSGESQKIGFDDSNSGHFLNEASDIYIQQIKYVYTIYSIYTMNVASLSGDSLW